MGNVLSAENITALKGRAVVITGCDTGFGYETTLDLLSKGLNVYSGCLSESGHKNLLAVKEKSPDLYPGKLRALLLDVTKDDSVKAFVQIVESEVPEGIYALINNAGIGDSGPFEIMPTEMHRKIMEVNYCGVERMMKALIPSLRKTSNLRRTSPTGKFIPKPRIVNIASVAARVVGPNMSAYMASKHAVMALTECVRMELRHFDILVTVIEPGFARTNIVVGDLDRRAQQFEANFRATTQEVQEAYGTDLPEYIDQQRRNAGKYAMVMKPQQVVSKIVKAVTLTNPPLNLLAAKEKAPHLYIGALRALPLDVTSDESVAAFVEVIHSEVPEGIFALINNAGVAESGPLEIVSDQAHRQMMEVNYFGTIRMMKSLIPSLRKNAERRKRTSDKSAPKPRIVNISSLAGRMVTPNMSMYTASKHAVSAVTECVRMEVKPFDILVTLVEPGLARTPLVLENMDRRHERFLEWFKNSSQDVQEAYGLDFPEYMKSQRAAGGSAPMIMDSKYVVAKIVEATELSEPP
ncbi:Retinol dehydrogenase 5 [Blyttiomyces sp. JEL0837]|nr:Retinol dehydrogenase 5 [Blyttiomyces sp. JEL0837]